MGQVGGVVVAFHKSDGGGQEGSREGRPEQSVCFFLNGGATRSETQCSVHTHCVCCVGNKHCVGNKQAFGRQGATGVPLFTTWDSIAGSGLGRES